MRLDEYIVKKGYVKDINIARSLIMQGKVLVDNEIINKPGESVGKDLRINILEPKKKYVSRGAYKLKKAIDNFNIKLNNKVALDIGASTGGFTQLMLEYGARKVYALDVGYGQLDWILRKDTRVVVMERTNIRNVKKKIFDERIDFISIDVSFISLELVLPVVNELLRDNEKGEVVALIKPQFEANREDVETGGVIKNKETHYKVLKKVLNLLKIYDFKLKGLIYSPIQGAEGNIEYLIYFNKVDGSLNINVDSVIENAFDNFK